MNLPWTEYQAALTAAKSQWWLDDEHDNFLALAAATNSAETVYQTTVNGHFLTWASGTAAAELAFVTTEANADYDRNAASFTADADYEDALAELDETWQINYATAQRAFNIASSTSHRNFVDTADQEALDAAVLAAETALATADSSKLTAYTIGESAAAGLRSTIVAGDWEIYTGNSNTASLAYVTATAQADETYAAAEANANYTRLTALAVAESAYDQARDNTLADALEALALVETPWATYNAAVAAADAVFTGLMAPAHTTLIISLADADRDLEIASAMAQRINRISAETAFGANRTSVAEAHYDTILLQVTAGEEKGGGKGDKSNYASLIGLIPFSRPLDKITPAWMSRAPFIQRAQEVLRKVEIPLLADMADFAKAQNLDDLANMTWALNRDHSKDYARSVAEALEAAFNSSTTKAGRRAAVLKKLDEIAQVLRNGDMYRYP